MKKVNKIRVVIVSVALLLSGYALASDWTLSIPGSARVASKLYCYMNFEIDTDGNWTATAKYSNGRKVEMNRFYSLITVNAKDGKAIMSVPQNYWLRGAGTGGATEKTTTARGQLTPKILQHISKDKSTFSCQTVRDDSALNALQTAVKVAAWVTSL